MYACTKIYYYVLLILKVWRFRNVQVTIEKNWCHLYTLVHHILSEISIPFSLAVSMLFATQFILAYTYRTLQNVCNQ